MGYPISKFRAHTTKPKPNYFIINFRKVTLNIIILINAAGELAWRALNSDSGFKTLHGSEIFYPVCIFITCLLTLFMLIVEKIHFIRSSANLSLFWPLLSICLVPNVKIQIENLIEDFDTSRFVLVITLVPICLILSLFQLWPDISDLEPKYENLAPNNTNSFFSSVFLSWMDPLIWKVW